MNTQNAASHDRTSANTIAFAASEVVSNTRTVDGAESTVATTVSNVKSFVNDT